MKVLLISILVLLVITIVLGFVLIHGIKNLIELMSSFANVTADNFVTVDNSVNGINGKLNAINDVTLSRLQNDIYELNKEISIVHTFANGIHEKCKDLDEKLYVVIDNTKPKPRKTKKTSEK